MCDWTSVWPKNSAVPQEQETKGCLLLLLSYLRSWPARTSEFLLLYTNCQCTGNGRVDAQGTWQHRVERHQNIPMPLSGPGDRLYKIWKWGHGIRRDHFGVPGACRSEIKQLSEQKPLPYWLACDGMSILIVILCHPKSVLHKQTNKQKAIIF